MHQWLRISHFTFQLSAQMEFFILFLVISGCMKLCLGLCTGKVKTFFLGADCQSRLWAEMPSSDLASLGSWICQKILFTYCKSNLLSCEQHFQQRLFLRVQSKLIHIFISHSGIFLMKVNRTPSNGYLSLLSILWSFRDLWWRIQHDYYDCFSRLRQHHRKLSCIMSEMYTDLRGISYFSFTDSLTAGVCTKLV